MAAGPTRLASLNRARIIRRTPQGLKDIPLPFTKILQAKTPDVALEASDIVYVPESRLKGVMGPSNVVGLLAGAAIYRLTDNSLINGKSSLLRSANPAPAKRKP
jgi:polysaccharide biosynthesis/export protein